MKQSTILCLLCAILVVGCKKETEEITIEETLMDYSLGIYVANEGSFLSNNSSITYIGTDGSSTHDLFQQVNNVELGDVMTSMCLTGTSIYAVLNNSQKIEVINRTSFTRSAVISGASLDYPRHMKVVGDSKAYVTNGSFEGKVLVVDIDNNDITGSIDVGFGPEELDMNDNYVFVANSGGWTTDNSVSVIDRASDLVVETVTVGDRPNAVVIDVDGDAWVLCAGEVEYDNDWNVIGHTSAELYEIDGTDFSIKNSMLIGDEGDHPVSMKLSADGQSLYFVNSGLFELTLSDITGGPIEINPGPFSRLSVDLDGNIWVADVPDYISNSNVYVLSMDGTTLDQYECGIAAREVYFD